MNAGVILTIVATFILPVSLFAGTDCRIVDLPDRYEAICVGDERYAAEDYKNLQDSRQNMTQQTAVERNSNAQAAASTKPSNTVRSKPQSAAVKQLIAYRQNKLKRSDVDAKRIIRMQMIQAGRKNQPEEPQPQQILEDI